MVSKKHECIAGVAIRSAEYSIPGSVFSNFHQHQVPATVANIVIGVVALPKHDMSTCRQE